MEYELGVGDVGFEAMSRGRWRSDMLGDSERCFGMVGRGFEVYMLN